MPIINQVFAGRTTQGLVVHPGVLMQTVGPILPIQIQIPTALEQLLVANGQPIPAPVAGMALIDTGATRSAADTGQMNGLGVNPIGLVPVGGAAGRSQHSLFPARFHFPTANFNVEFGSVIGVNLAGQTAGGQPLVALIGRDVLQMALLVYNGTTGTFSLSF